MGLKTRLKEKNLPPLSFQIARDRISRIHWNNKVCFLRDGIIPRTDSSVQMKRRRKRSSHFRRPRHRVKKKKKEERTKNKSQIRRIKYSGRSLLRNEMSSSRKVDESSRRKLECVIVRSMNVLREADREQRSRPLDLIAPPDDFLESRFVPRTPSPLPPLSNRERKRGTADAVLKNVLATIGGRERFFIVHSFGKRLVNIVSGA